MVASTCLLPLPVSAFISSAATFSERQQACRLKLATRQRHSQHKHIPRPAMVAFGGSRILLVALWALLILPTVCAVDPHTSSLLPTYYELLESPPTATDKELKKAYRRLALTTHPDKATSDSDRAVREGQFIQLSNAYEVLSNADLRPRYDYLLTQHIHVYDDRIRDWSTFDPATGQFSRPARQTVSFGDGRFGFSSSYADARQRWEAEQAEETREKRALLLALLGSLAVAVTPVCFYYYQQIRQRLGDKKRKAEANVRLKVEQQALVELQEEKAEEEKRRKEDERRRAAELRRQRDEAALADDDEEAEDAEGESGQQAQDEAKGAAEQASVLADEAHEDEVARPKKGGSGAAYSCELCRKRFKSEQQSANNSTQHIPPSSQRAARARRISVCLSPTCLCCCVSAGTTIT